MRINYVTDRLRHLSAETFSISPSILLGPYDNFNSRIINKDFNGLIAFQASRWNSRLLKRHQRPLVFSWFGHGFTNPCSIR